MIDRELEVATRRETAAARYLDAAGRYLASGQAKINEFLGALGFRPEMQPFTPIPQVTRS